MALHHAAAHVMGAGLLDAELPPLAVFPRGALEGQGNGSHQGAGFVLAGALGHQRGDFLGGTNAFLVLGGIDQQAEFGAGWSCGTWKHFVGLLFWDNITQMHAGKLQAIGESLGVIIPAAAIRELGWQKGDYIAVEVNGDEVTLHNVKALNVRFSSPDGRGRNGREPVASRD